MRYSQCFVKTLRQPPKDADTTNHKLLTQAGFVEQLMAGVYTYLPLGLKVLRKIEQIVREEMNQIGGQELLMPMLHPKDIWVKSGGWDKVDVLFKINSRTEKEYALGMSEEEVITPVFKSWVKSYKDLPVAAYQIHWKFRDELRAKSGIMRGREFFMKDMYSVHENEQDFYKFYDKAKKAYLKIYSRLGLTAKVTEAAGGAFSEKISYEFMVLTDAGEDDILYCPSCDFCINVEITDIKEGEKCHRCGKQSLKLGRASEAGNVFELGQKYPKTFDFSITGKDGSKIYPFMGCYGIGISRTMGLIVEKNNDKKGIIWPEAIAPFCCHLVALDLDDSQILRQAENIYSTLYHHGFEVFFDDRLNISAGEKFADADLIGIPHRLVISKKTEHKIEYKKRSDQNTEFITIEQLLSKLINLPH